MTTIIVGTFSFSSREASKPLLNAHYRNRLPIHCSVDRAIKMADDIANGNSPIRMGLDLKAKNVREMAHVLMAFVQQREDL